MRKLWIDSLRGIAMLLVVYGHCVPSWKTFLIITNPVKMPLFFAISGYLFNLRNGDEKQFFVNLFYKLFVPWIILGMIFPYTDPFHRFISLLLGYDWFMPTLILSEIIWFYIRKFSNSAYTSCIWGITISIIGLLLHKYTNLSYTIIYNALIVQFFFVIGFCIKIKETFLSERWKYVLFISVLAYIPLIWASLHLYPGIPLDVHLNIYYNIPICCFLVISGCIGIFLLFKKLNIASHWLVYIGQNTFVIYMLHGYAINVLPKFFRYANINLSVSLPIEALLRTFSGCIICCIIAMFINRLCPFVVGKKRKSKNNPHIKIKNGLKI